MDSQFQLVPVSSSSQTLDTFESDAAEAQPSELITRIWSILRQRARWAIVLALLGLSIGAYLGYHKAPVEYTSNALIQVHSLVPHILYNNDHNGIMPGWDAYLETQIPLFSGEPVLNMVLHSPQWKALNRGTSNDDAAQLMRSLVVGRIEHSELIQVSATDNAPDAAMAVAKAVVSAYEELWGGKDKKLTVQQLQALEDYRTKLKRELKEKNDQILAIGHEFGSTDLQRAYDFKSDELNQLDSALLQLRVAMALSNNEPLPTTLSDGDLTPEILAKADPQMAVLLQRREEMERNLQQMSKFFGPNHRMIVDAKAGLESLQQHILERVGIVRQLVRAGTLLPDHPKLESLASTSIEVLKKHEQNLLALQAQTKEAMLNLGRKRLEVESLRTQVEAMRGQLKETDTRIDQLSLESSMTGWTKVLSYGDRPLVPSKDRRRPMAAAAGFGGAGLSLALLVFLGFINPRYRTVNDACVGIEGVRPILGVIPDHSAGLLDPQKADLAAHCVHHVRTMLQLDALTSHSRVYAITSPSPGSGKTSLTLALGVSFAVSGSRTLLIDADLVGGGLSARLGASDKGLSNVLAGEEIADCITATGVDGLSALPLGTATAQDIGRLSANALKKIIDNARASYDMILIDTGPVPASIESSMVSTAADKVVLVICKGEQHPAANRAVEHLRALGARMAGMLFNRAAMVDLASSGYSSTPRQQSISRHIVPGAASASAAKLGPLPVAVVSSTTLRPDDAQHQN